MHLFLCQPDFENALADELCAEFDAPVVKKIGSGVLHLPSGVAKFARPVVGWAKQMLPDAERIVAPSIKAWADALGTRLIAALASHEGPWRLLATPSSDSAKVSPRRIEFILAALDDVLKRKQKRLLKTRVDDPQRPLRDDESLAQIVWTNPETGWWSICDPEKRNVWSAIISRFPGGYIEPAHDLAAPARAFAKLVEAELRLGRNIRRGETCVDLGASPGSWTWWAVQRDARVEALDRSPLREDLMESPLVRFTQGDAFAFRPAAAVDWLLCDVAAFPQRSFELLSDWLNERRCRAFVFTFKFRGTEGYELLPAIKSMLRASGYEFMLKHLNANKNEMTALGFVL